MKNTGRISVEGEIISLTLNNEAQSIHSYDELEIFYCLRVGSDVQANDSICYLLLFSNELWLIPELTHGVADCRQWFDQLRNDKKVVVATLDYLPFSWRAKFVFLPGIEANLTILARSEFNKINNKLSIVDNITIEEAF